MLKLKLQYFGQLIKNWLIRKDCDAGKDWRHEEKGMTEVEMVGWHHWHNGHWVWVNSENWWWTARPGMLWFMGSQRVGHDWATELNWSEWWFLVCFKIIILFSSLLFVIFILYITVCYSTFIIFMYFLNWFLFKPFGQTAWHVGSYFPDQELSLCPHSLEAWSPNHWTTREVLYDYILPVRIFLLLGRSITRGSVIIYSS